MKPARSSKPVTCHRFRAVKSGASSGADLRDESLWASSSIPVSPMRYDVQTDPSEARNLAAAPEFAQTLVELRTRWEQYQMELK